MRSLTLRLPLAEMLSEIVTLLEFGGFLVILTDLLCTFKQGKQLADERVPESSLKGEFTEAAGFHVFTAAGIKLMSLTSSLHCLARIVEEIAPQQFPRVRSLTGRSSAATARDGP
jgi:hypothetical protein